MCKNVNTSSHLCGRNSVIKTYKKSHTIVYITCSLHGVCVKNEKFHARPELSDTSNNKFLGKCMAVPCATRARDRIDSGRDELDRKAMWSSQQGISSLLLSLVFIMYFWAMTKFLKFLKQRQVCCF